MAVAYSGKTPVTQKANGSVGAAASVDFASAVAAGDSVYSFQMVRVGSGAVVSSAQLIKLEAGGTPVSPAVEHDMTPVASVGLKFEATTKQLSIYRHDNTDASRYRATITAGSTGAAITAGALSFSGALSLIAMAVDSFPTENNATTLTVHSLPEGANLPIDEGVAVLVLGGTDGQANYNWQDLSGSGWTKQLEETDGSAGLNALAVYTKVLSADSPITVSPTFNAATYGAAGMLMLLLPQEASAAVSRYVKLRAKDNAPQGLGGINVSVFLGSGNSDATGDKLFDSNGNTWNLTEVDGGATKAVMHIPMPDASAFETPASLNAGDNLNVVGGGTGHGINGVAVGEVIEVIEGS